MSIKYMNISNLISRFPDLEFKTQESLAPYTYMKVGGPAEAFVTVHTQDDLFSLSSFCFKENISFLVLGGASNVVIPDEGIQKLVIRNQTDGIHFESKNAQTYEV